MKTPKCITGLVFVILFATGLHAGQEEFYLIRVHENRITIRLSPESFSYADRYRKYELHGSCLQPEISRFYKRFHRELDFYRKKGPGTGDIRLVTPDDEISADFESSFGRFLMTLSAQGDRIELLSQSRCREQSEQGE